MPNTLLGSNKKGSLDVFMYAEHKDFDYNVGANVNLSHRFSDKISLFSNSWINSKLDNFKPNFGVSSGLRIEW